MTHVDYADRYQAMKPMARKQLKDRNPKLHTEMRDAWCSKYGHNLDHTGDVAGDVDVAPATVQFNGVAFENMKPLARKALKDSNEELYNALRESAVARGAL